MSDYVTFNSISRAEPPGANGQSSGSEAFQAGFEAGLRAAAEQQAPSREIAAQAGGNLVGGMRDDGLYADSGFGANSFGTDPFGMNLGATGQSSFAMPGFDSGSLNGVLQQLNQLMQLLTLFGQLEQLMSQMQGGQSGMVTPIGMPGGNDFMRGGPGTDRLEPEMTILPYDPSGEIFGGNGGVVPGAAPDAPVSPVRDPLDDWYVEGQGDLSERQLANIEAVMTGRGAITLSTDPMTNETDFVQGLYPFDETRDMLAIINRDGMHGDLHGEAMWWLSRYGVSQNGLDAAESLFALEGDDFSNAYMDLMRTPMAEQLGAALDGVAGRQFREERAPSSEGDAVGQDIGEPELYTEYPDDFDGERQEAMVFDKSAFGGLSWEDLPRNRDHLLRVLDEAVASNGEQAPLEEEAA